MSMHQTMEEYDDEHDPNNERGSFADWARRLGIGKESTPGTAPDPTILADLYRRARDAAFKQVFPPEPLGDPPTLQSLIDLLGVEQAGALDTLRHSVATYHYAYDDCHHFTLAERRRIEFEAWYRADRPDSK